RQEGRRCDGQALPDGRATATRAQSTSQKENHMQFGSSDNLHHHRKGISCRPPDAAHSFFRWAGKLFNNPLTYIALVWGLMFLALGVTLAYAQGAAPIVNHQSVVASPRATPAHTVPHNHRSQR
ncbi:MAG: hypothetical protein ACREBD_29720, partial [Blastocatellia bacterium]